MLSSWLLFIGLAFAECPDPEPSIRNAEQDAVSYFLADAEAGLAEASASFHCAQPSPNVIARFFLARAMIWSLQEDERYIDALHRAKQLDPEHFTEELGEEMKKKWTEVEVETLAPTIALTVRGLRKGDAILIDGTEIEIDPPATTDGLHLVQVKRKGDVVYGRVVEAEAGSSLELTVGAAPPTPKPTASAGGTGFQPHFQTPVNLAGLKSADGKRLSMVRDVVVLASLTPEGRTFAERRRRNTFLQGIAIGAMATGPSAAYLGHWDLAVGHNMEPGTAAWIAAQGVGLTLGGLVLETVLKGQRRRLKKRLVEQANVAAAP